MSRTTRRSTEVLSPARCIGFGTRPHGVGLAHTAFVKVSRASGFAVAREPGGDALGVSGGFRSHASSQPSASTQVYCPASKRCGASIWVVGHYDSAVVAGAGIARGSQYGESDATASSPKEKPVHPADLLATVYFALGLDPDMEIRNHLNQPRELVKGTPVMGLWS